ncbi:MAG: hypothetical protein ACO1OB_02020 [Archangium sp.]
MRLWFLSCLLAASAVVAAPKKPSKPNVVVSGPPAVTRLVTKSIASRYTAKPLKKPVPALPTAKEVRDATAPQQAVALVIAAAQGKFITLQVLNGADGTPLDTIQVPGTAKKPPKTLARPQLAALLFALGSARAPGKEEPVTSQPEPVAEPKPEPKPEPVAEKKPEPKPEPVAVKSEPKKKDPEPEPTPEPEPVTTSEPGTPSPHGAIRVYVGGGIFNRTFNWIGQQTNALGKVDHPASGNFTFDMSVYPAAGFTSGVLANFGAFASADVGLNVRSRTSTGFIAHNSSRIRAGVLARLPIGDRFNLHAHLGYSRHALGSDSSASASAYPDVLFNGFRGGIGLRLRIVGSFELEAQGGFQYVADKGELGRAPYFPNATGFAVDAGGALSIEIVPNLRLRAAAEWQRYFITLNPGEDAMFIARAAGDQYIWVTGGLQWAM